MIRVLFVSHSSGRYGAERSLLEVVGAMRRAGHECLVALPKPGPLAERLRESGVATLVTGHRFWVGPPFVHLADALPRHLANFMACRRLPKLLDGFRPDCVYTNTLASPFGALAAERLGVPHVWHVREFIHDDFGLEFDLGIRRSLQYVERTSQAVICNSQAVAGMVERHAGASRIRVVYNGVVDESRRPPVPRTGPVHPGEPVLALVGSLMPHKGHSDAIRAVGLLRQRGVPVRLRIVGTSRHPWYPIQIRRLVRKLGLAEWVAFEGFLPNAGEAVFPATDIALVCSRCEAFGRTAAEAMAAGCPVVGTRAGGLPEVLDEPRAGLLYTPGDVPRLADTVAQLLAAPDQYAALSAAGIARAYACFTRARYVREVEAVVRASCGL